MLRIWHYKLLEVLPDLQFNAYDEEEKFGLHYSNVGYGSRYDGCHIDIDMCCDCFDKMMEEYIEPKLKFEGSAIRDYEDYSREYYKGIINEEGSY